MRGKRVVLGVTGGIAVYKACELARAFIREGATVHAVMTPSATKFVAPLTFRTLTGNPVGVDTFDEPLEWDVQHVELGRLADVFVVAPATANTVGKVAGGIADSLLTCAIMATKAPVVFVPAMNSRMYENPVFRLNVDKLRSLGYRFMEPGVGGLACGEEGIGRMPEPAEIVRFVRDVLASAGAAPAGEATVTAAEMRGLDVLVTAGPTHEPLDPVRYISNRSSGKMGFSIAEECARRGARVSLVTGPVSLAAPQGVEVIPVVTTAEMREQVLKRAGDCAMLFMAAAVSDWMPAVAYERKVKRSEFPDTWSVELKRTPDILGEVARTGPAGAGRRVLVGFAAETLDVVPHARAECAARGVDMVVANDVSRSDIGFGSDYNEVTLVFRDGSSEHVPRATKARIAATIVERATAILRSEGEPS